MLATIQRRLSIYAAIAGTVPKLFLAYSIWVWVDMILQVIAMTIAVFFWRAVYQETSAIAGLQLQQTLNYILLAQVLSSSVGFGMISRFGQMMHDGSLGIELIRPIDLQLRFYIEALANLATGLVTTLPTLAVAMLVFGLRLPLDPLVWLAFLGALVLGQTVLFFFEWLLGCMAFYTTEVWGLSVVRYGVSLFFSGTLIPLVMMPSWLQAIALALPFAQGLYVPASLLTGVAPLSSAPGLLLTQAAWIAGLLVASRLVFRVAVRKVTIQGG